MYSNAFFFFGRCQDTQIIIAFNIDNKKKLNTFINIKRMAGELTQ